MRKFIVPLKWRAAGLVRCHQLCQSTVPAVLQSLRTRATRERQVRYDPTVYEGLLSKKKGKDTNQRAPKDVADWKCGKTGMKTDDHIHRSKAKQLAIEPTKPFGSSAPQKAHEILMQPDSQLGSRRRSASRWRMRKQLAPACLSLQAVCGA